MSKAREWTPDERFELLKYPDQDAKTLADKLDRTVGAIKKQARIINASKKRIKSKKN